MTKNNIKAILFASLIVALILPFSAMSLADAAPNENANDKAKEKTLKQQFDEISQEHNEINRDLQKLEEETGLDKASAVQESKKKELKSKLTDLKNRANEIRQKNIEAHKMPAGIKQILESAKDKVIEELDFSIVYINGKTRTLTVFVASEEHVQPVIDLVGYVDDKKTHLEVSVDPYTFSGCTAQDAECNPVMGRIQMDGNGDGACRIAVPFTKGTTEGFLTAGHCVNASSATYQPQQYSNKIGSVSQSNVEVEDSCDCAWVSKHGSKTFSERIFDYGFSNGSYYYYSIDDHNTPTPGDFLSVGKKSGIVHSVEFLDYGTATETTTQTVLTDMMVLDTSRNSGDSGGPIFGNITHDFHGIISGGNSQVTVASHWDNIESQLGL